MSECSGRQNRLATSHTHHSISPQSDFSIMFNHSCMHALHFVKHPAESMAKQWSQLNCSIKITARAHKVSIDIQKCSVQSVLCVCLCVSEKEQSTYTAIVIASWKSKGAIKLSNLISIADLWLFNIQLLMPFLLPHIDMHINIAMKHE